MKSHFAHLTICHFFVQNPVDKTGHKPHSRDADPFLFFQNWPFIYLTGLILTARETSNISVTFSHELDSTSALSHMCFSLSRTSGKFKFNNANGNPWGTQWSPTRDLSPCLLLGGGNVFHTATHSELLASSLALAYTLTLYIKHRSSPGSSSHCCLVHPISI